MYLETAVRQGPSLATVASITSPDSANAWCLTQTGVILAGWRCSPMSCPPDRSNYDGGVLGWWTPLFQL
jgi:hypothetical protein